MDILFLAPFRPLIIMTNKFVPFDWVGISITFFNNIIHWRNAARMRAHFSILRKIPSFFLARRACAAPSTRPFSFYSLCSPLPEPVHRIVVEQFLSLMPSWFSGSSKLTLIFLNLKLYSCSHSAMLLIFTHQCNITDFRKPGSSVCITRKRIIRKQKIITWILFQNEN